jgi:hypothetical protein
MQQLVSAAKALLGVDGAGLMLADERGDLRWATASDQQTQIVEDGEERLGQGPCVNAFAEHAPMAMRDATKEPHWGKITDEVTGQEMRAGLSVPVQLEGGPIGSLDLYSAKPRDWDQAEISAAQVLDREGRRVAAGLGAARSEPHRPPAWALGPDTKRHGQREPSDVEDGLHSCGRDRRGQSRLEQLLVEAGPDLAGEDQLVAAVVAEQQGAEAVPGPLGVGVPADHQLLLVGALELQPVA